MKVSFIIPVYNAAKYLPRLIESLKAQKHSDWEALFTDDGSTDGSLSILNEAASNDARIRVFQIVHQGSSGARNKGLDNATGEIVGFIDADDFIHPQLIEASLPYFEEAAADSVVWDYATVEDGDDYEFQPVVAPPSSRVITDPFKWAFSPWQPMAHDLWRSFYRRKTIGTTRFYPSIKHQDLLFTYQVWGGVRKMIKIDAVLYAYVQSSNSIMRSRFSADKLDATFIIMRELYDFYFNDKRIREAIQREVFPRFVKNTYKSIDATERRYGELHRLADKHMAHALEMGWIRLGHFSLGKRMRLLKSALKGRSGEPPRALKDKVIYVSCVRDFSMYEKLVRNNSNNFGGEFVVFDNAKENKRITERYNSFLEAYDFNEPAWFVFLHEDFQLLEPIAGKLSKLGRVAIYGTFGATTSIQGIGLQIDSDKDGSRLSFRGLPCAKPRVVDTVDCQCLIVHSTTVRRFHLRFDESLSYDLYAEDAAICAKEKFGLPTKVLPIRSHHYSYGTINDRFLAQLAYMQEKYSGSKNAYRLCFHNSFIGNRALCLAAETALGRRKWRDFLFKYKITHKGNFLLKVFGVTVYHRKWAGVEEWNLGIRKDRSILFQAAICRMKKLALRLRTRKPDYARLQPGPWRRTAETVEKPVSVIVPVYNGYDAIVRLTRTLFAHTNRQHTIVFINDASPDVRIKPLLERFAAENPNVRLMSNECNLGFAATVNKAIEATENDFVLLNTDTEVPQDWIPRLFAPIWSNPATASATPTTCESHLLGVPTPETGTVQFVERHGVEAIDKAVSRIKPDLKKDILVEGVGFCLAISRKAWDEVGPFAAEVFGRGYGEEADWCLRAHYCHGYENRFASNLFVAHWHGGSFTKEETLALQKRNNRLLALRNPRFGNDRYLQALAKRGRKELWALATRACEVACLKHEPCNPIVFVSVVRDFPLYNRLVRDNKNNIGANFIAFDNRKDNHAIPVRYNSFLDGYDYSKNTWFVFCHEDFRFLEPLGRRIGDFDKDSIYGIIGARDGKTWGREINSNRDGSDMRFDGIHIRKTKEVDTVDCQCIIVHSALVNRCKLRFDENLSFDFYAEDFSISAFLKHNIRTFVCPIRSWHYSFGNKKRRFFEQQAYLRQKYADSSKSFETTVHSDIGNHNCCIQAKYKRVHSLNGPIKIRRTNKGR